MEQKNSEESVSVCGIAVTEEMAGKDCDFPQCRTEKPKRSTQENVRLRKKDETRKKGYAGL